MPPGLPLPMLLPALLLGVLLLGGLSRPASSQTPASAPPRPVTLHQAWLHEVLDLDVAAAAAEYERIASTQGPGNLDRWVATARLLELHRLQAIPAAPANLQEAPLPLRTVGQSMQVLPTDELLERARRNPAEALPILAAEAGKLPPLRPAVATAEEWLMGQIGPSLRDTMRQRLQSLASRSRSTEQRRFTERLYAFDIARAELQGRPVQANALRTLYFGDWQAPQATGDPLAHLERVRSNLEAWLLEPDLGNQQQAMLRELRDGIEQRAATDPAAALALVLSLPLFAERLLENAAPSRR